MFDGALKLSCVSAETVLTVMPQHCAAHRTGGSRYPALAHIPHYPFGVASSKAIGLAELIGGTPPWPVRCGEKARSALIGGLSLQ